MTWLDHATRSWSDGQVFCLYWAVCTFLIVTGWAMAADLYRRGRNHSRARGALLSGPRPMLERGPTPVAAGRRGNRPAARSTLLLDGRPDSDRNARLL